MADYPLKTAPHAITLLSKRFKRWERHEHWLTEPAQQKQGSTRPISCQCKTQAIVLQLFVGDDAGKWTVQCENFQCGAGRPFVVPQAKKRDAIRIWNETNAGGNNRHSEFVNMRRYYPFSTTESVASESKPSQSHDHTRHSK